MVKRVGAKTEEGDCLFVFQDVSINLQFFTIKQVEGRFIAVLCVGVRIVGAGDIFIQSVLFLVKPSKVGESLYFHIDMMANLHSSKL